MDMAHATTKQTGIDGWIMRSKQALHTGWRGTGLEQRGKSVRMRNTCGEAGKGQTGKKCGESRASTVACYVGPGGGYDKCSWYCSLLLGFHSTGMCFKVISQLACNHCICLSGSQEQQVTGESKGKTWVIQSFFFISSNILRWIETFRKPKKFFIKKKKSKGWWNVKQ
jgi:hypothetical protein